jgi:predicted dehydrogenase
MSISRNSEGEPAHAALIGCGRIGFLLEDDPLRYKPCTHWGGARAAGVKIDLACDINPRRRETFSERARIAARNVYSDYRELLEDKKPSLVIIATWTDSHAPIAIEAARQGAGTIVLEKPVAPDLKSAAAIVDACDASGARLVINHERRYDARYRRLKKIIDDGLIGEVKTVQALMLTRGYRGTSSPGEGGGPLMHDGTHLVDMIRFLFGDIVSVRGEFQRYGRDRGFEDRAVAWMKTRSGVDVFLEAGGARDYFVFELQISASRGKIVIGNGYEKLFMSGRSRLYTGFNDLEERPYPRFAKNNCFRDLYREVKEHLRGRDHMISSGGMDGYRAVEAIHGAYYSAHLGGKEIALPLHRDRVNLKKIFNLV